MLKFKKNFFKAISSIITMFLFEAGKDSMKKSVWMNRPSYSILRVYNHLEFDKLFIVHEF